MTNFGRKQVYVPPEGAIRRNLHQSEDKAATLYYQFVRSSELCR